MSGHDLLRLVELAPEDADAVLVYADWLEETGELARAAFLRAQQQIRGMRIENPKLLERGRALHELGKTLPREWVEAVTSPRLAGTAWHGQDDDGFLVWRFLPSGALNYTQPAGTYENGRWTQIGPTVAMDTNARYAEYFGVVVGDVMRGTGNNVVNDSWRWKVVRSDDHTMPDYVDRTTYRGPAIAKPAPSKPAKPKALPRRTPLARKTPLKRRTRISTRSR